MVYTCNAEIVHVIQMGKMIVCGLVLYALVESGLSCFQCFVDADETSRLCKGYILSGYDIVNLDHCFKSIHRIFNNNTKIIQAAHVGEIRAVNYICVFIYSITLPFKTKLYVSAF